MEDPIIKSNNPESDTTGSRQPLRSPEEETNAPVAAQGPSPGSSSLAEHIVWSRANRKIKPTEISELTRTDVANAKNLGGWIAPDGDYFRNDVPYEHIDKAAQITGGMVFNPDDVLERQGWVHLSSFGDADINKDSEITQAQRDTLWDLACRVPNTSFSRNIMRDLNSGSLLAAA